MDCAQRMKALLDWNREHLIASADLSIEDLEPLFAPAFQVKVNGREYDAIMVLKFNPSGRIIHWQEVYSLRP